MQGISSIARLVTLVALLTSLLGPLSTTSAQEVVNQEAASGDLFVSLSDSSGAPIAAGCFAVVDAAGSTWAGCDDDGDGLTLFAGIAAGLASVSQTGAPSGFSGGANGGAEVPAGGSVTISLGNTSLPVETPVEEPTAIPSAEPTIDPTVESTAEATVESPAETPSAGPSTPEAEPTNPAGDVTPEASPSVAAAETPEEFGRFQAAAVDDLVITCSYQGPSTNLSSFTVDPAEGNHTGINNVNVKIYDINFNLLATFNFPNPPGTVSASSPAGVNLSGTVALFTQAPGLPRKLEVTVTWKNGDPTTTAQASCNSTKNDTAIGNGPVPGGSTAHQASNRLSSGYRTLANNEFLQASDTFVRDTAIIAGLTANATGSVVFQLYDNPSCSGTPLYTSDPALMTLTAPYDGTGSATGFPTDAPTDPGVYYWVASYSGDEFNEPSSSGCAQEFFRVAGKDVGISKSAVNATVSAGEAIQYRLTVTNILGAVTGITVSDQLPSGVTWPSGNVTVSPAGPSCSISPTGLLTCAAFDMAVDAIYEITVTSAATNLNQCAAYTNDAATITVPGESSGKSANNTSGSATVTVQCPSVTIAKTPNSQNRNAGQSLTFTITVSNAGPGKALNVKVADTLPALPSGATWTVSGSGCTAFPCTIPSINASANAVITAVATSAQADCGVINNTASVTEIAGVAQSLSDGGQITVRCPSVSLTKTAAQSQVSAGQQIAFTIAVTNAGPGSASNVQITDVLPSIGGTANWSISPAVSGCSITGTAPNQTLSCTFSSLGVTTTNITVRTNTPKSRPICAEYSNSVSATASNQASITGATASVTVLCVPDVEVTKSAAAANVNPGEPISFTISLENIGTDPATTVVLTDTLPAGLTWTISSVTPSLSSPDGCSISGGVLTCAIASFASDATLDIVVVATPSYPANCGPVTNTSASATVSNELALTLPNNTSGSATTVINCPDITVTKVVDDAYITVGGTAGFTITAKNDGPGIAEDVVVTDALPVNFTWTINPAQPACQIVSGSLTCNFGDLDPNETASVHIVSDTATAADAGDVSNTAAVSATNEPSDKQTNNESTSGLFVANPVIDVTKDADKDVYNVGETITYTYVVTNAGNVALGSIALADNKLGAISCPASTLAVGADMTCTATKVVTDPDGLVIANTATVNSSYTAPDNGVTPVSDTASESVTVNPNAAISITKTASPTSTTVGGLVTYTYLVVNTGNVPLTNVSVTDDKLGTICSGLSLAANNGASGGPDQTTCSTTHVIVNADGTSLTNIATATGLGPNGETPEDADDATVTVTSAPGIDVTKDADKTTYTVGETITYTYLVKNTGNVPLTNVTVTDDKLGAITCPETDLAIGAQMTCTATHVVVGADTTTITNTVVAEGDGPNGESPIDSAVETVNVTAAPSIQVVKSANKATYDIGETITYTYAVTNTGNVPLSAITLSDNKLGALTCPATSLPINGTMSCSATKFVSEADIVDADGNEIANIATVKGTGTGPGNSPVEVTDTDDETVTVTPEPAIQVIKTASPSNATVGQFVQYTYVITNVGDVTLNTIILNDDKLGFICSFSTLALSDAVTCGAGHVIVVGDGTSLTNVGTVTAIGPGPDGEPVDDSDDATVTVTAKPGISIVKTASPLIANVGQSVTYSYLVTNTGNEPLVSVAVEDDLLGPITCPATSLDPGEDMTCSRQVDILATDPLLIVNIAVVSAETPGGTPVENADDAIVKVRNTPSIEVIKTADPISTTVGETVTYSYLVRNTGNVALSAVSVTDDKLGSICSGLNLLPTDGVDGGGDETTCTKTHVVTVLDGVRIDNIATAAGSGRNASNQIVQVTDIDDATVTVTAAPAIDVTKDADKATYAVGETVTYTYVVKNTGNVPLSGVELSDDKLGAISCPAATLGLGESTTCTATHVVANADGTGIENVATASGDGDGPAGSQVTVEDTAAASIVIVAAPSIDVVKSADETTYAVGETVTYTYLVKNTGNVLLSGVELSDDKLGAITCPQTTLAVGGETTCSATHVVVNADGVEITNVAAVTATGDGPSGPTEVEDTDTVTVDITAAPSIGVEKSANKATYAIGETITYTYVIENTGNVPLSSVELNDDKLGAVSCPTSTLAIGGTTTCTATHAVVEADIADADGNEITNIATATGRGTGPAGPEIEVDDTATETVTVNPEPSIQLVKTATDGTNPITSAQIADSITYRYVVTNTGDVTLNQITLVDTPEGTITCPANSLAPAGTMTCTLTRNVVEADVIDADGNVIYNTATVTGTSPGPDGETVDATDDARLNGAPQPSIVVLKSANKPVYAIGETVTYTYQIINTGDVSLTSIELTDDKLGAITCPADTLIAGDDMTCTATHIVVEADITDADGVEIANLATVEGTSLGPDGETVNDSSNELVTVDPAPAIQVVKSANKASYAIGETITYTYQVTNTGDVSLGSVALTDDKLGAVTCPKTALAVAEQMTCTATHVVVEADVADADGNEIANTATVTASSPGPDSEQVSDQDDETVTVVPQPAIIVEKSADKASYAIGETITYTYVVTNDGDVSLRAISLSDDRLGTITCPQTTLAVDRDMTCTATHVVVEADITDGDGADIENTATVRGTGPGPDGSQVTDVDDVTVTVVPHPAITLTKTATNGTSEITTARIGDGIVYVYVVTNTGDVTLSSITVSDPQGLTLTLPKTTLAAGESMTFSANPYVVTEADITDGDGVLINYEAETEGRSPLNELVDDADDAPVTVQPNPAVSVTKDADKAIYAIGETATYTYAVTNNGDVTLNAVSLTDDKLGAVTCPQTTLAADGQMTCTATHVVVEEDIIDADGTEIANQATAKGTGIGLDGVATEVSATADELVQVTVEPEITVDKSADPTVADINETVTYSYVVTNTGDVSLSSIALTDDKLGLVTCPATILAVDGHMTCTATHVVLEADIADADGDELRNVATVRGTSPGPDGSEISDTDDETIVVTPAPAIEVVKSANAERYEIGETITYTYAVTNTGDVSLSSITLTDDKLGAITCPDTVLAVDGQMTCTATHEVVETDIADGDNERIHNVATVEGTSPGPDGQTVSDTDTVEVVVDTYPAITITKTATDGTAEITTTSVGEDVVYVYVVMNTGDVTLDNVSVTDPQGVNFTLPKTKLAPGESMTFSAQPYEVTEADISDADGALINYQAAVEGYSPIETRVTDEDDAPVTVITDPAISITKTATDGSVEITTAKIGDEITYDYVLTNTGDVTLFDVTVTDPQGLTFTLPKTTLAPGESMSFSAAPYEVTESDISDADGALINFTARTEGVSVLEEMVSDEDDAPVTVDDGASISLTKIATDGLGNEIDTAAPGGTVVYVYLVENTGDVTLHDISLTDPQGLTFVLPKTSLAPGESMTFSADPFTVTEEELTDADGVVINYEAKVTGLSPVNQEVADRDDAPVTVVTSPAVTLVKSADRTTANINDTVTYSYEIKNTGDVTLIDMTLEDDKLGVITCPATTLAVGDTMTCTATHVVGGDDVFDEDATTMKNTAVVRAYGVAGDAGLVQVSADSEWTIDVNPVGAVREIPVYKIVCDRVPAEVDGVAVMAGDLPDGCETSDAAEFSVSQDGIDLGTFEPDGGVFWVPAAVGSALTITENEASLSGTYPMTNPLVVDPVALSQDPIVFVNLADAVRTGTVTIYKYWCPGSGDVAMTAGAPGTQASLPVDPNCQPGNATFEVGGIGTFDTGSDGVTSINLLAGTHVVAEAGTSATVTVTVAAGLTTPVVVINYRPVGGGEDGDDDDTPTQLPVTGAGPQPFDPVTPMAGLLLLTSLVGMASILNRRRKAA